MTVNRLPAVLGLIDKSGAPHAALPAQRRVKYVDSRVASSQAHAAAPRYRLELVPIMLHHLSFGVRDLKRSGAFYDAALGALGFRRVFEDETAIGYGWLDGQDKFCLKLRPGAAAPGPGFHLAFSAPSREAVDTFHRAALEVGGRDNGAPGLRPGYGPHYYAAFLVDPEGHRIEAVCKVPGGQKVKVTADTNAGAG